MTRSERAEAVLAACETITDHAQARDGESFRQRMERLMRPIRCASTQGDGNDLVTFSIEPRDPSEDCEEPTLADLLIVYAAKIRGKGRN
jgi:hypothetical protein